MIKKIVVLTAAVALSASVAMAYSGPDRLIPAPVEYSFGGGVYTLRGDGSDVKVSLGGSAFEQMVRDLPEFAREEAYRLTINKKGVRIEALTELGVIRARQSLEQMRLLDRDVRHCVIFDYPRFRYRGVMIDESRSFKGKDFILKQIDALALLRMNVMHLHLTDAAGWRLQIDAYPRMTDYAAWRIGEAYYEWEAKGFHYVTADYPQAYGGFYTKDDIRQIVAYAAERGIEIIPEIEMPGHSIEVGRAYPEISCLDDDGKPLDRAWNLCVGNEGTFRFLETVLEEVMELFPCKYIHIGGDEAIRDYWERCSVCREFAKEKGMSDLMELQGYLLRHIEQFIRERGKVAIGWDEIVEDGLPEQAVVMSWRGTPGGIQASSNGHDVIMSPNTHVYLDYIQDIPAKEPKAVGHLQSLRRVYGYDPTDGIAPEYQHHILGLQGNLWCEMIPYPSHAEYMLYPRVFAIAETGWTPKEQREFFNFRERALALCQVFRSLGYSTFDLTRETLRAQSGRDEFDPDFPL